MSGSLPRIRRRPGATGHITAAAQTVAAGDDRTHIIRRAPLEATNPFVAPTNPVVAHPIPAEPPAEEAATPVPSPAPAPSPGAPIAASAAAIVGGWATAVLATELITGWWNSDRLFCVAVGFLAVLFAGSTVAGVILLLLRRGVGRWMVVFGAAVALLTFGSVFVAGARLAWPVYFMPLLPLASLALALHPATRRWSAG